MQKTSTQVELKSKPAGVKCSPKKSTVDFIKQFARAYTFNAMLPVGLGALIAN